MANLGPMMGNANHFKNYAKNIADDPAQLEYGTKRFVGEVTKKVNAACGGTPEPLLGSLQISVELRPPDARKRDIDNHLKALQDALEVARVYEDDAQIVDLHAWFGPKVRGGRVNVVITQIDG